MSDALGTDDIDSVEGGRAVIDDIDAAICDLVRRRRVVSKQIQALRLVAGGPRIEYNRENQIIAGYNDALGRPGVTIAMAALDYCRGDRRAASPTG